MSRAGWVSSELDERIRRVSVMPEGTARTRDAGRLFERMRPIVRSWAWDVARTGGSRKTEDAEDLAQTMLEKLWIILRTPRDEAVGGAYLRQSAVFAGRRWLTRELQQVSGATGAVRRLRRLARTRSELERVLERVPTAAELVDAHNRAMRARRSDPAKQGVLVDLDEARAVLVA